MTVFDRRAAREQRRQENSRNTADAILKAMTVEGMTVCVTHLPNTSQWQLSNGASVSEDVAGLVIARPEIIGIGDTLLDVGA
jgi:hypothetical protein